MSITSTHQPIMSILLENTYISFLMIGMAAKFVIDKTTEILLNQLANTKIE